MSNKYELLWKIEDAASDHTEFGHQYGDELPDLEVVFFEGPAESYLAREVDE